MPTVSRRSPAKHASRAIFLKRGTLEQREGLQKCFPISATVDSWQFSHIHKTVLGIYSLSINIELQKTQYKEQIDWKDSNGKTPLHWAAHKGDDQVVQVLLQYGANPNAFDNINNTPLHLSARLGSLCCTEYLLSAGANVHVRNQNGESALHYACEVQSNLAIVKALIEAGSLVNLENNQHVSPLARASTYNAWKIGRFLLLRGANINCVDNDGDSALPNAIVNGHLEFFQLLLSNGINYTIINKSGQNILHWTAAFANVEMIQILSQTRLRGVDMEAKDSKGRTPREVLDQRLTKPKGFREAFEVLLENVREANRPHLQEIIEENEDEDDEDTFMEAMEVQEVRSQSVLNEYIIV